MQRPWPNFWRDLFLRSAVITEGSIRAVEHKLARAGQRLVIRLPPLICDAFLSTRRKNQTLAPAGFATAQWSVIPVRGRNTYQ
jgi:hypothetical protein